MTHEHKTPFVLWLTWGTILALGWRVGIIIIQLDRIIEALERLP